jgi:hypothetical protein
MPSPGRFDHAVYADLREERMGNKKKRNKSKKPAERPGYKSIPLSPAVHREVRPTVRS